ncbi:HEAT repeat protein [Bradyrhizobium japonicum USDA 38]|uniref:HEAT repeat domain-containing protein n=1 Tax=Bradyrhizobium japonicum TaxID=375 RepID=UPI0004896937|nr:HEAT repeat domain-containing protein [Bradyrhizobium japonicum]MCS3898432.1 HEAT repeat protein [Bradyrhizobium japonicum USDA 38]MCS3941485.1 HEAT repeat protein [Bradyrhizobium japonicum]
MPLVRRGSSNAAVSSLEPSALAAALSGGSIDERWAAARSVADMPNGLSLLGDALSRETDPRVREAIFTSMVRTRTPESAAAVLPYLRSDDASLRAGALDALRLMPEATASHLPGLLIDKDADVRVLACELVRNQPVSEASRLLQPILATESQANVCGAAVEVLAEVGGPDVLPFLAACARRFPDDPFLSFAIQVARGRIGSQASSRD